MAKVRVDKRDMYRVLLTETLPYEVPIIFSNEGLYNFSSGKYSGAVPVALNKILDIGTTSFTVPYNYSIKKSIDSRRTLSVIHPAIQRDFVRFYSDYDSLLINLCGKSSFSLRAPVKISSHYYEKSFSLFKDGEGELKKDFAEVDVDGKAESVKYASSYFSYKKYNLIHKFYDSYEFLRLEKKFSYLLKFDISKCFPSIYTHSIAWAVKSKSFAKRNTAGKSFESDFDKIMQMSNYKETNGIVVGPEISRIFAEIILQKIDCDVEGIIKNEGLVVGRDYDVRRYVDDYFVFSNKEDILKKVLHVYQQNLEKYKLYLNNSKTTIESVPFITTLTIAKNEIYKLINNVFDSCVEDVCIEGIDNLKIKAIRRPSGKSNSLIRDYKCIIQQHSVNYESVVGYTLSIIRRRLFSIVRKQFDEEYVIQDQNALRSFILFVLDFMFFIYSMDKRVRTTYIVSQIIVMMNKVAEKLNEDVKESILKKIYDEGVFFIRGASGENGLTVETLNMLIALKTFGSDYKIDNGSLLKILGLSEEYGTNVDSLKCFSYFETIAILYYIGDAVEYSKLRESIENYVLSRFISYDDPFNYSEQTHLFFDYLSCPYISKISKEKMAERALYRLNDTYPSAQKVSLLVNYIKDKKWFTNWDSEVDLSKVLMKKELRSPY